MRFGGAFFQSIAVTICSRTMWFLIRGIKFAIGHSELECLRLKYGGGVY